MRVREDGGKQKESTMKQLEVIVHITPRTLFTSSKYRNWMSSFGIDVNHITLHPYQCIDATYQHKDQDENETDNHSEQSYDHNSQSEDMDGSPFRSAATGAMTRSLLCKSLYPSPFPINRSYGKKDESHIDVMKDEKQEIEHKDSKNHIKIIQGRPGMKYILIPIAKSGIDSTSLCSKNHSFGTSAHKVEKATSLVHDSGALALSQHIISSHNTDSNNRFDTKSNQIQCPTSLGEILFTGTGSAIPCKHRNVSGIYMRMENGNGMLLDVGEGTTGQLLRSWKNEVTTCRPDDQHQLLHLSPSTTMQFNNASRNRIRNIKAVWISHPHADHHLGILRFLSERNAICDSISFQKENCDDDDDDDDNDDTENSFHRSKHYQHPIVLMAPPNMFHFLSEYEAIDPTIQQGYIPLDCRDMLHNGKRNPLGDKLYDYLGITYCVSIPVNHCQHSYGILVEGTAFGRVVYGGDCRPSNRLANVAFGADLLIHEATFEDGMEEEAVLKRHSTVSEALGVGKRMGARAILLTHFSQRYPRIPPVSKKMIQCKKEVQEGRTSDDILEVEKSFSSRLQTMKCDTDESINAKNSKGEMLVAFAFDFMKVTPSNLQLAGKLTPALRLLYPDTDVENDEEDMTLDELDTNKHDLSRAKQALATPGFFASNSKTLPCNGLNT